MKIHMAMSMLAVLLILTACGQDLSGVLVDSVPRGASILSSEGEPLGLKTPAFLDLDLKKKEHKILVAMPGYKSAPVSFRKDTRVDVISPSEATASILCSPCCCGLPLLNLLDPVDIINRFVPSVSRIELSRTGGGVFVTSTPSDIEMVVDTASHGMITAGVEAFIPLPDGIHDIEFRSQGFESMRIERLRVDSKDPVTLLVNLKPITGALCLVNHEPCKLPLEQVRIVDNSSGREVFQSRPAHGSVTAILAPGSYRVELEGRTTTGKVLSHSEAIHVTTGDAAVRHLSQLGPWKNVRAWMGVSLTTERHLNIKTGQSRKVVRLSSSGRVVFVAPDSPASKAGILKDDTLLSFNGHLFESTEDNEDLAEDVRNDSNLRLKRLMMSLRPGDPLLVQVLRDDEIVDLKIETLGSEYVNESEIEALSR